MYEMLLQNKTFPIFNFVFVKNIMDGSKVITMLYYY